jgi:hypothetical protein
MSMKSSAAIAGLCFIAPLNSAHAQSQDDALPRLEAKLDALAKENGALRNRVSQIEATRQAPTAVTRSTMQPPSASKPNPAVASEQARNAYAADMPVKAAALSGCPAARFGGFYGGVHAGGVSYTANRTDQDGYLTAPLGAAAATYVMKDSGAVAGGQIGYTWTRCNALWGIEVDGSWASAETAVSIANFPGVFAEVRSELKGMATARTRAGVVVDSLLLYVTGGVAAARTETTWSTNFLSGLKRSTSTSLIRATRSSATKIAAMDSVGIAVSLDRRITHPASTEILIQCFSPL